ncbi:MAG: adenosylmethionine decarboxylase [Vampirovibrionia bacterium]
MEKVALGVHILLNLYDCEQRILKDLSKIECILNYAVTNAGMTKVGEAFHEFHPSGVTGVILLSESHICIHTWPEHNMAAIDVFSCKCDDKAQRAVDILVEKFKAKNFDKQVCQR